MLNLAHSPLLAQTRFSNGVFSFKLFFASLTWILVRPFELVCCVNILSSCIATLDKIYSSFIRSLIHSLTHSLTKHILRACCMGGPLTGAENTRMSEEL